ncbi:hypothetical protein RF11_12944 [Thelohanellus kitauei]|uniref:Uncharacterized protein n=1 Tax=Thelohanellus kitauei TaxID=669202 RepID=A0A0C2M4B8_THEKT|nr:hypothetical protein RF11_12944 [Thelohanellus kitauei]
MISVLDISMATREHEHCLLGYNTPDDILGELELVNIHIDRNSARKGRREINHRLRHGQPFSRKLIVGVFGVSKDDATNRDVKTEDVCHLLRLKCNRYNSACLEVGLSADQGDARFRYCSNLSANKGS